MNQSGQESFGEAISNFSVGEAKPYYDKEAKRYPEEPVYRNIRRAVRMTLANHRLYGLPVAQEQKLRQMVKDDLFNGLIDFKRGFLFEAVLPAFAQRMSNRAPHESPRELADEVIQQEMNETDSSGVEPEVIAGRLIREALDSYPSLSLPQNSNAPHLNR